MNYIISDYRLSQFMLDFLDERLKGGVSRIDSFIIVHSEDENNVDYDNVMLEYDKFDGRLYIYKEFLNNFSTLFPFGVDNLREFIKVWFESKFHVQVKFTSVSS